MTVVFDPALITYQIISLQCFYYVGMGLIFDMFYIIFENNLSLDNFFNPKFSSLNYNSGFLNSFSIILSGIIGSFLLSMLVERSKKCVDFTFTLYLIHIFCCVSYNKRFPLIWEWWVSLFISGILMASIGEFLCARSELEDIPLYVREEPHNHSHGHIGSGHKSSIRAHSPINSIGSMNSLN